MQDLITTTMNSDKHLVLEIATELNNIGVHLLQAKAYDRALKTFTFAIDFMNHPKTSRQDSETRACKYLLQAEKWLEEIDCDKMSVYIYDSTSGFQDYRGSTIGEDTCLEMSDPILFNTFQEYSHFQYQEVEVSILFYNLALTHIRVYDDGFVEKRRLCNSGAITLLEMSLDLITDKESFGLYGHRKFLATLVLNELMDLQVELGRHDDAHASMRWLMRLDDMLVGDVYHLIEDTFVQMAPAA